MQKRGRSYIVPGISLDRCPTELPAGNHYRQSIAATTQATCDSSCRHTGRTWALLPPHRPHVLVQSLHIKASRTYLLHRGPGKRQIRTKVRGVIELHVVTLTPSL